VTGAVGIQHEVLLYDDADAFVAGVAPFVRDGVDAGEAVLCALPVERIWLLREALGADAEHVEWADMVELGRNPARIIPAWRDFLGRHPGRTCRGVGEPIWVGRSPAELLECERHEHLLNVAFATGRPWRLLCPYDATGLPAEVLATALHTHPTVLEGGRPVPSAAYTEADPYGLPLPALVEAAIAFPFAADDLHALRAFVRHHAAHHELPDDRVADLVLAANELASNSIRHAGGAGVLRIWSEGWSVVCEVRDTGRLSDVLVGRRLPRSPQEGGRGLWLANHLCDLVQVWSGPDGTAVRLHVRG
jgi:anti-sigma regulatory factor (Ser/Thr protein kinase)